MLEAVDSATLRVIIEKLGNQLAAISIEMAAWRAVLEIREQELADLKAIVARLEAGRQADDSTM